MLVLEDVLTVNIVSISSVSSVHGDKDPDVNIINMQFKKSYLTNSCKIAVFENLSFRLQKAREA